MTPNKKRDIFTSPKIEELKQKRQKRSRILALIILVFLAALIVGLSYLSHRQRVRIQTITVSGTHIIDNNDVEKAVQKDLAGNYMRTFARSNILIYPKRQITADLLKQFPRIQNLALSTKGFQTLNIAITERTGSYLWCGADIPTDPTQVGENCYFVNSDGYIFDTAPYFSGNVYFKFYVPLLSSTASPLTQQMLPKILFQQIVSFTDNLQTLGLTAVSVTMEDPTQYAFQLAQENNTVNPQIYWNSDNDLPTIFENLATAYKNQEFANEITSKYSTLQYIDLRFDNKVLYKFQ